MPLHLIKLAVGCESVKELKGWVAERMKTAKKKEIRKVSPPSLAATASSAAGKAPPA